MIMKVVFFLLNLIVPVLSVRNRNIKALSDEEYDLMIRKITGTYNIPVAERNVKETRLLRKYYIDGYVRGTIFRLARVAKLYILTGNNL